MNSFHRYSLTVLKEEVRQLVEQGVVSRQQSLYSLYEHIPPHLWTEVEQELEKSDFLLRDRIGELISYEKWDND